MKKDITPALTFTIFAEARNFTTFDKVLERNPVAGDFLLQASGHQVWWHIYEVNDLVHDVNLVAALSHLYPLILYRFDEDGKVITGRRDNLIDVDDYINFTTSRNWNIRDILTRNYSIGYNLYSMDIRCNLSATYHNLMNAGLKQMAEETDSLEELIPTLCAEVDNDTNPLTAVRDWLTLRINQLSKEKTQDLDEIRITRQRITVCDAVRIMCVENIRDSEG